MSRANGRLPVGDGGKSRRSSSSLGLTTTTQVRACSPPTVVGRPWSHYTIVLAVHFGSNNTLSPLNEWCNQPAGLSSDIYRTAQGTAMARWRPIIDVRWLHDSCKPLGDASVQLSEQFEKFVHVSWDGLSQKSQAAGHVESAQVCCLLIKTGTRI